MTYDTQAETAALELHARLAKPAGSLGRLEALGARLAGMAGTCPPPVPVPAAVAGFAADHGVVASGVTPWPQEITAAMVATFASGRAAVNAIARQVGAEVVVVDVGVATPYPPHPSVLDRRVRAGTDDLAHGPAMSPTDAAATVEVGRQVARELVDRGIRCLLTGDMGIGNTTPAAALLVALTGGDAAALTGRGTGIDDDMLDVKRRIVTAAAGRVAGLPPMEVLAEIGGLEIGAIAGFVLAGADARVPVIVDGVIALAGAVLAVAIDPSCRDYLVAGHRSVEPAASAALTHLGLDPLLDLDLRLGEGTGALLALPLVQAAARVLSEMATLDELT
jgi:nicotinate-nucleotide--dimethylbenzimidazole phosphoribosyltransferase